MRCKLGSKNSDMQGGKAYFTSPCAKIRQSAPLFGTFRIHFRGLSIVSTIENCLSLYGKKYICLLAENSNSKFSSGTSKIDYFTCQALGGSSLGQIKRVCPTAYMIQLKI